MVDWDDFEYAEPELEREPDQYEVTARNALEKFFEAHPSNVFFGNQLAVQNEDTFFIGLPIEPLRIWWMLD